MLLSVSDDDVMGEMKYKMDVHTMIYGFIIFSQRVADRLYGVYKVHGNYGRVFR